MGLLAGNFAFAAEPSPDKSAYRNVRNTDSHLPRIPFIGSWVWSYVVFSSYPHCCEESALFRPLMPAGVLLLVQECVEHGLLNVHFVRAPIGVDEGIPDTLLELRVLFLQVVSGG